jgi:glycosyltransferase involved in cell wall biosynthesis
LQAQAISIVRLLIFLDTDHVSGPARLTLDFARQAIAWGHDARLASLVRDARRRPTPLSLAAERAGLEMTLLHERHRFDLGVVGQFRRLLEEVKPDLYQSHDYKGSVMAHYARRAGVPWQAVFHGYTWENPRVRFYHWLNRRWLRRADEVVTVSRPFAWDLRLAGIAPERLRWIPNAIDEEALRQADSGEDLRARFLGAGAATGVVIGVLGRFSPEKAPASFIDAFELAAKRVPGLHGMMFGEGPLLEACRRRAKNSPNASRLALPGFREDLAAIYRALDMLVIPSLSEGMPTVMIEGMLMGVPIVSTRVGAVPDILEHERTALIVPPGDVGALADAMARLAGDALLRARMAEAAQRVARERLTVRRRAEAFLEHAQCLVERRPLPQVDRETFA